MDKRAATICGVARRDHQLLGMGVRFLHDNAITVVWTAAGRHGRARARVSCAFHAASREVSGWGGGALFGLAYERYEPFFAEVLLLPDWFVVGFVMLFDLPCAVAFTNHS